MHQGRNARHTESDGTQDGGHTSQPSHQQVNIEEVPEVGTNAYDFSSFSIRNS